MKKRIARLLPVLALLAASSLAARADQFSDIQNDPNTYWVPSPTPPPAGYVSAPPPQYYGPPPGYYAPPPPAVYGPPVFIHFHFH